MSKSRKQRQVKERAQRGGGARAAGGGARAAGGGARAAGGGGVADRADDGKQPRAIPAPSPPKPNRLLLGICASVFAVWAAYLLLLVVTT
jgi:hypothetical protein